MAEKLSITIALEGAAEIERQLEGIGQAGTKAFTDIGAAAEKAGGFDKLDPKAVQAKLEQFGVKGKAAIDKITAAVAQAGRLERIVGGVQQVERGFASIGTAAVTMGTNIVRAGTAAEAALLNLVPPMAQIRSLFRVFGVPLTIGGLGAAAVGLEVVADRARILEGNLQALFRNAAAGTQFFNQIKAAAQSAGGSLQSTGKTMLDIVNAIQQALTAKGISFAPGKGLEEATKGAAKFIDTLQKGMKLSGATTDEANKSISALFDEIRTKGTLSGDTLRKLAAEFPQLANELVKFLGVPGQAMQQLAAQVDKGIKRIDINKFMAALEKVDPTVQKLFAAFEPTLAQRMDTIGGAWERLLDSFGKSPAGDIVRRMLADIAKGLDEIAEKKPPATWTGQFIEEGLRRILPMIETTKKEWEALVALVTQPVKNLGLILPDKITVPFEVDPEPPFVEAYLKGIEKIKIAFNEMIKPPPKITVPFEADPEPPWVEAYLRAIENVKDKFRNMFKTEAEGPPQQPAWVEAYLGWIAKVKAAFLDMFTKRPEAGGQLGGGAVPFLSGQIPSDVVARGAARVEDRRGEGLDTTAINAALTELATAAQGATQSLQGLQGLDFSSIGTAVDSLNTAISAVADSMQGLDFSGMAEGLSSATAAAQQLGTDLQSLELSDVASAMQAVVSAAYSAADALSTIQAQASAGRFARGGFVGGRGTGTSDSNLAWVSRGEHIMPARAVRQPGVLAFLEALRRSGGSLRDVLDDMGRFALGGLVPRQIPAFASGGLAGGGMSNVTIQFPGLPPIEGLRASETVIDELRKAAALAQVRSGGRKPSRYT